MQLRFMSFLWLLGTFLLSLFSPFWVKAQSGSVEFNLFSENPLYITAIGEGNSPEVARAEAQRKLTEQIVVVVSTSSSYSARDTGKEFSDELNSTIFSSSSLKLFGLTEFAEQRDDVFVSMVYISKNDLDKSFMRWRTTIESWIKGGEKFEQRSLTDQAMRYYYQAFLATNFLYPYNIPYFFYDDVDTTQNARDELRTRIEMMLERVELVADTLLYNGSLKQYEVPISAKLFGKKLNNASILHNNGGNVEWISLRGAQPKLTFTLPPSQLRPLVPLKISPHERETIGKSTDLAPLAYLNEETVLTHTLGLQLDFSHLVDVRFETTKKGKQWIIRPIISHYSPSTLEWRYGQNPAEKGLELKIPQSAGALVEVTLVLDENPDLTFKKTVSLEEAIVVQKASVAGLKKVRLPEEIKVGMLTTKVLDEVGKQRREGRLVLGYKPEDFIDPTQCVVLVADRRGKLEKALQFHNGSFFELGNGKEYASLSEFKGKIAIWVQSL